jgi:hypothetical protein
MCIILLTSTFASICSDLISQTSWNVWPHGSYQGGSGCICASNTCTQNANTTFQHVMLLQWFVLTLRGQTEHSRINNTPCVQTATRFVGQLDVMFRDAELCALLGCPLLPLALPLADQPTTLHRQSVRSHYCDPVSYQPTFPASLAPICQYARVLPEALFVEGALIQHRTYRQTIFLLRNGTLHIIPNFSTFLEMGFDTGDIHMISDVDFGSLDIADPLPAI